LQNARDKGAALLMAIVSVMVLMLISSVFFTLVINRLRTETLEEKILKSYSLAEAGINFAFFYILSDPSVANNIYIQNPTTMPSTSYSNLSDLKTAAEKQSFYQSEGSDAKIAIDDVILAWGHNPSDDKTYPNSEQLITITVKCTGTYLSVSRTLEEQYALSFENS
jgi:hypothetical protein